MVNRIVCHLRQHAKRHVNSETALRLQERGLRHLAEGHLEAMEEDTGAAGAYASFGKGLQDVVEEGRCAFTVEAGGHFNGGFAGPDGKLGAGVEVTEIAAAHDRGLAMESAGHDASTFGGHRVPSRVGL